VRQALVAGAGAELVVHLADLVCEFGLFTRTGPGPRTWQDPRRDLTCVPRQVFRLFPDRRSATVRASLPSARPTLFVRCSMWNRAAISKGAVVRRPFQLNQTQGTRMRRMNKRRRVYEGKAKVLYEGPEPGTLIQHFKDDATAFNNKKHALIEGKGVLNNRISEHIFAKLGEIGVPTHFVRRLNMREQLIREVEIIP